MATLRRYLQKFGNRFCASTSSQLAWLVILSAACIYVYYQLFLHFTYNHLQDEDFLDAYKCPACYGTGLCRKFRRGEFRFHSYSTLRFLDFVNVKNVYYGTYLDQKPVVLKKLGHDSEHNQFDKDLCSNAEKGSTNCDVSREIYKSKLSDIMYADMLEEKDVMGLSDLVRCPSQRLLEKIWYTYDERQDDSSLNRDNKLTLATTIAFNPEPIILQIFPRKDGWPFPAYLGACGRFIVEEYSGHSLGFFYKSEFTTRAALAVQVLAIAMQLTENREEFALYLTDVTEDNFAVTADGEIHIVDAENIIVVDRKRIKDAAKPGWDTKHQAEHTGCGSKKECLMFSHTDLCNHYYSDHNYYAICYGLFNNHPKYGEGGLLHDIDPSLSPKMTEKLTDLIKECRDPATEGGRYVAVKQLKALLAKLI